MALDHTTRQQDQTISVAENFNHLTSTPQEAEDCITDLLEICASLDDDFTSAVEEKDQDIKDLQEQLEETKITVNELRIDVSNLEGQLGD